MCTVYRPATTQTSMAIYAATNACAYAGGMKTRAGIRCGQPLFGTRADELFMSCTSNDSSRACSVCGPSLMLIFSEARNSKTKRAAK